MYTLYFRINICLNKYQPIISRFSADPRSTPMYCPFEVNPDNRREFRPNNSAGAYQTCKLKFYFSLRVCTCMPTSAPPGMSYTLSSISSIG